MGVVEWLKQQWEGLAVGMIATYFGKDYVEKKISEYAENLGRKFGESMRAQATGGQDLKYKTLEDRIAELEKKSESR